MSLHSQLLFVHPDVSVGSRVLVGGSEGRHAVAVRRIRMGEQMALMDGAGRTLVGEVVSIADNRFEIVVATIIQTPRPSPELIVVQAIPKGDRGELAVEVLTEVGVGRIVPWAAERCQVSWKGERGVKALGRWRSTAREATKQSHRAWLPEVSEAASTAQIVALLTGCELAVVLHESAAERLTELDVPSVGSTAVVVGPEGGVTDAELDAFTAAGAHAVRLGSEVLRTSTAGLAASAALLARTPRWR